MFKWEVIRQSDGSRICEAGDFLPKCICEPKYITKLESLKRAEKPRFCKCAVTCWRSVCRCSIDHCLRCLGALAWKLFCIFLFGFVHLRKSKCATKSVGYSIFVLKILTTLVQSPFPFHSPFWLSILLIFVVLNLSKWLTKLSIRLVFVSVMYGLTQTK